MLRLALVLALLTVPRAALGNAALQPFAEVAPRCPEGVRHCFDIALHVVVKPDGPVQQPAWLTEQLLEVHRTFAPLSVGFRIGRVKALPASQAEIVTRADRDRLVALHKPGAVHVFVVERLANVDEPGDIRGVHWRYRPDRTRRYVIESAVAGEMVLAHELGHFFGVPHSLYPESVMNKEPREEPPYRERIFVAAELAKMRRGLKDMLASGLLRPSRRRR